MKFGLGCCWGALDWNYMQLFTCTHHWDPLRPWQHQTCLTVTLVLQHLPVQARTFMVPVLILNMQTSPPSCWGDSLGLPNASKWFVLTRNYHHWVLRTFPLFWLYIALSLNGDYIKEKHTHTHTDPLSWVFWQRWTFYNCSLIKNTDAEKFPHYVRWQDKNFWENGALEEIWR